MMESSGSQGNDRYTSTFLWYDFLIAIAGMLMCVFDVFSDIWLAAAYFSDGHVMYGAVTLTFVALAYIVTVIYALHVYKSLLNPRKQQKKPHDNEDKTCPEAELNTDASTSNDDRRDITFVDKNDEKPLKASGIVWCCRTSLTLLMFGPVVRYVDYINIGCQYLHCESPEEECKIRKKYKYYQWRNSILGMLQGSLEAAPQLLFQLYVLLVSNPQLEYVNVPLLVFTLLSSWFSLAHAFTTLSKSSRTTKELLRTPFTFRNQFFDFLWRLPETGGRILCMACFASVFGFFVLAVVIPHVLFLVVWEYWKEGDKIMKDILGYFVLAIAFVFAFFDPFTGTKSRMRYVAFYLLFYVENFTMLLLWYLFTPDEDAWLHTPILVTVFLSFTLHILLQLLYYKRCHPNSKTIETCTPCALSDWKAALL